MKTKVFLTASAAVLFSLTGTGQVNSRFGFELNGGFSMPSHEVKSGRLDIGFGFESILHYRFMTHTGLYGGWGWNSFNAITSFAGSNIDFEETGYVIGLQFKHPVEGYLSSYYLRAGLLYNHIEIENERGDIIQDSGHGTGFQLAAGIDVPLSTAWSFTAGVRHNSLPREIEVEGNMERMKFNYFSVRVGILKKF